MRCSPWPAASAGSTGGSWSTSPRSHAAPSPPPARRPRAGGPTAPDGSVGVGKPMPAGSASLWVANTGPVIPAAEVDGLFQPFQQLGAPPGSPDPGHGGGGAGAGPAPAP